MRTPFFGPFSVTRSSNLSDNRLINMFPEVVETKQGKDIGGLFGTPGLDFITTVGTRGGPIRGTHPMGNLLFVVSGPQFYKLDGGFGATLLADSSLHVAVSATVRDAQVGAGSYIPGDALTLVGGVGVAPEFRVVTTQVASIAINAAGAGGTPGTHTFSGTTGTVGGESGTGQLFQFTGDIDAGGALVFVRSLTVPGNYAVNPTSLAAEPIVDLTDGALVGATVTLKMGVLIVSISKFGALTSIPVFPVNPVSTTTTGTGTGATLDVNFQDGAIASGPVTMIDNGRQVAMFAGQNGYVWSEASGFGVIDLPFTPTGSPVTVTYQDGFGLINQAGSSLWFQSDLLDLATWSALKFADASGDPDNIVAIVQIKREIWLIKEFETEIWYNVGTSGFAFARLDGAYVEQGIAAPQSLVMIGESLIWLAQNNNGSGQVMMTRGHTANRISTHAIETEFAKYGIEDAVAYAYQQDGHDFYVINFPSGDATWCYDITESAIAGVSLWHQRASFSGGEFHRHFADNHSFFAGKHVVGDYRNGNLYALNLDTLTDNGAPIKRLRSWRALSKPSEDPVRFNSLRIDMQTGIGVAPADDPLVVLRWSDDGGHVFSNEKFAEIGRTGDTVKRVLFRRLGSTRRNSGLDRIFELSSTDQFLVAIIGAELDAA